jgi:hypothetical protein
MPSCKKFACNLKILFGATPPVMNVFVNIYHAVVCIPACGLL